MKQLTVSVETSAIHFAQNGDIMCEVSITYKNYKGRKSVVHVFNVSKVIREYEK